MKRITLFIVFVTFIGFLFGQTQTVRSIKTSPVLETQNKKSGCDRFIGKWEYRGDGGVPSGSQYECYLTISKSGNKFKIAERCSTGAKQDYIGNCAGDSLSVVDHGETLYYVFTGNNEIGTILPPSSNEPMGREFYHKVKSQ